MKIIQYVSLSVKKKKILDTRFTALVPSLIKMVGAFIVFMFIKISNIMVENSFFLKHILRHKFNTIFFLMFCHKWLIIIFTVTLL